MLSNQQFDRIRRLALDLAGIELVERHQELLGQRCRRTGILDDAALEAFLCSVEGGDTAAARRLLHLLTTKFTGFFRHPMQFKLAAEHALKAAHRSGHARLWSAGAATGEESYSLAMAIVEASGRDDPPVAILATDLDEEALAAGLRGEYAESALKDLEPARRERFFQETGQKRYGVGQPLRRLIEFRPVNLVASEWPVTGPFDVIVVRNVLMYLEASRRDNVVKRMATVLEMDGLLMIDPVEGLGPAGDQFIDRGEGVFIRRPDSGTPFAGDTRSRK